MRPDLMRGPRFFFLPAAVVFATLTSLGCVASTDDDAEQLDSELGAKTKVDIRVAAFIPCAALSSPEPRFSHYYAGDARGFSYELARTRSRAAFDGWFDTKGGSSFTPIIGETKAYNGSEITGHDGQCYALVSNPSVARRGTADASRMTSRVVPMGWQTKVFLGLHATNPIAWLSPSLDADFTLTFESDAEGVPVAYWIDGAHDGFPAFEIYVNGKAVYTYDGIALGHSAFYLEDGLHAPERVWISRRPMPK